MRRTLAIARKEFYHVIRDVRSLALAVAMPLMMVFLYGFALDMEMKNLPVGVLDCDCSPAGRDLVRRMTAGRFITDAGRLKSRNEVDQGFRRDLFRAVLVIPRGYQQALSSRDVAPVQILVDGADGTTAAAVNNYLNAVISLMNRDLLRSVGGRIGALDLRVRVWYNPELVSAHFIVPGLAAVILIMICVLLTSIAITREKETGTMEQMLTTPVLAWEVIIGKVVPYIGIGALDAALVLLAGRVVFGVPMAGSWWALAAYSFLYLIIALALGLLISAVTRTQRTAMTAALMGTVLPTIMLSGFIFPLSSMPWPLQAISHVVPARYYVEILRGIMLRGELYFPKQLLIMCFMAFALLPLAAKRFRSKVDMP